MAAAAKPQITICRTCLRDNPGEGAFANFESCAEFYQQKLKRGWLKKAAELRHQNCFSYCEQFYCVAVTVKGRGWLLKKISSEEKIQEVIQWIESQANADLNEVPENFKDYIIGVMES